MTSPTLPRSSTRRGTAYVDAGAGAGAGVVEGVVEGVGVGVGEPVVLLHGVGLRLDAWAPQLAHLATSHRVIAVDLPGHGASAPLPAGSRLERFAAWFTSTLDDLGLDEVNVVGHSMGALIAGWAATHEPARVRRVALVCGVHRRSPEAAAAVRARAAQIAAGGVDQAGALARWFPDVDRDRDREARALTERCLRDVDAAGYATAYAAFADGDEAYADRWPSVSCPALFITGELDPNSTPAMSHAMAAAAPRGEAVVVADHRHMAHLTAPDTVNAALGAWLARKV